MYKCPICGNETDDKICNKCGYDIQDDYVLHNLSYQFTKQEIIEYQEKIQTIKTVYQKNKSVLDNNTIAGFIKKQGDKYYIGKENLQDYKKAKEYYQVGANLGNTDSMVCLGEIYELGKGVVKDKYKATCYYELAANLGNIDGMYKVANMYYHGIGVKKDYQKAKIYNEKAAKLGNIKAMNNLAYMYKAGVGVKQNYQKAKKYYEQAAKLGDKNAIYKLNNWQYD